MNSLKMFGRIQVGTWSRGLLALAAFLLAASSAQAVPAFARQTGQDCIACHVGGFGPQLTPFGRAFKLSGYTLGSNDNGVPLSAMLVASYTHTSTDNSAPPAGFSANNNITLLQQASVFLAGRMSEHVGVLAQATYSDPGSQNVAWDNSDLRYANQGKLAGRDAVWGVSVNNNPTVSDVWNTVPAWQFGFMTSPFGSGNGQTPLLLDLGGRVLGTTVYTLYDDHWYAEAGLYHQLSTYWGNQLHAGGPVDPINGVGGGGVVSGYAPYWRLNYSTTVGPHNYEVGLIGMQANLDPQLVSGASTERYRDTGVDASYQYLGQGNYTVSANALYLHETQNFTQTYAQGLSSNPSDTLNTLNLNTALWYRNTYGATVQLFQTSGSTDALLYAGTTGLNPGTRGATFELDWNPYGQDWSNPEKNLRLGLQYTSYSKFQGSTAGASDNNSLYLYVWTAI